MIARIVIGSGRARKSIPLPCYNERKKHVSERLAMGNILKSNYLFRNGRGFKAAKARGEAALAAN